MGQAEARPEPSQSPLSDTTRTPKHETESLEQQRANLVRALVAAEQSVKIFPAGSLQHDKARARVTRLQNELRLMKGRLGIAKQRHNLGDFLIAMFRERVTRAEWQRIVAEARRRHDSEATQKRIGALAAGSRAQS